MLEGLLLFWEYRLKNKELTVGPNLPSGPGLPGLPVIPYNWQEEGEVGLHSAQ